MKSFKRRGSMITSLSMHLMYFITIMKQKRVSVMLSENTKNELSKLGDLRSSYDSVIFNLIRNAKRDSQKADQNTTMATGRND
jgi:hypothetical protein